MMPCIMNMVSVSSFHVFTGYYGIALVIGGAFRSFPAVSFFPFSSSILVLTTPELRRSVYHMGLHDLFLCFYAAAVAYDLFFYFLYLIPL